MTNSLTIRIATKEDLAGILKLYAQPDLDNGSVLSESEAELVFNKFSNYPDYRLYVALFERDIIGTFSLLIMDNIAHHGAKSAVIEDVAVDPAFQGKGFGKAMMSHALIVAKEAKCYKVMLSSNVKREKAHKFYESLDFERHGYSFRIDL